MNDGEIWPEVVKSREKEKNILRMDDSFSDSEISTMTVEIDENGCFVVDSDISLNDFDDSDNVDNVIDENTVAENDVDVDYFDEISFNENPGRDCSDILEDEIVYDEIIVEEPKMQREL